ncbi:hypothetical protein D3C71_1810480 [compost metagenome]
MLLEAGVDGHHGDAQLGAGQEGHQPFDAIGHPQRQTLAAPRAGGMHHGGQAVHLGRKRRVGSGMVLVLEGRAFGGLARVLGQQGVEVHGQACAFRWWRWE